MRKFVYAVILATLAAGFIFYKIGEEQTYLRGCGGKM